MKQQFQQISIIYFALLMGQMFFAAVAYATPPNAQASGNNEIFQIITPLILVGTIGGSFIIFQARQKQIPTLEGWNAKIEHFRIGSLLRWAMIEGGNFFALVVFFLERQILFFALFLVGLAVFISTRPTAEAFAKMYQLSTEEERSLRKD